MGKKQKTLDEQLKAVRGALKAGSGDAVPAKPRVGSKRADPVVRERLVDLLKDVTPMVRRDSPTITTRAKSAPPGQRKQAKSPAVVGTRGVLKLSQPGDRVIVTRTTARQEPPPAHRVEVRSPRAVEDAVILTVSEHADILWRPNRQGEAALLSMPVTRGYDDQLPHASGGEVRDVVIGLDLGTSSTKVVINDQTVGQSFAVPFLNAIGINGFLLPSRLYQSELGYALEPQTGSAVLYGDLKLKLLENRDSQDARARVAAFLALVIRRSRAWLFDAHRALYLNREILWSLSVGQPASHAVGSDLRDLYVGLGHAAWELAASTETLTHERCLATVWKCVTEESRLESIEVIPIPEIAAQIFGFVTSSSFDAKARNVFVLVDVGAGTVDSCLFRVFRNDKGLWNLEVFTSSVRSNGVMNLHRHRVDWWTRWLESSKAPSALVNAIRALGGATELQTAIPAGYEEYVGGVEVRLQGKTRSPDRFFFDERVLRQVQGETLHHAFSTNVLDRSQLSEVPFFLCGGGGRLEFYRELRSALKKTQNYGWLNARGMEFVLPKDLIAPTVVTQDFDRLSVAYGLSKINYGNASRAVPMPKISSSLGNGDTAFTDAFISKDLV